MIDEDERVQRWLSALDERHLADLTPPEVARALRALSSCYVERRGKLAQGGALDSAGKRAAFALFYAPLHFFIVREIVSAPEIDLAGMQNVADLGCGTGAAGAAIALRAGAKRIAGIDRHPWAVAEANRAYRDLGLSGKAIQTDVARAKLPELPGSGLVLAYTVNELPEAGRNEILPRLLAAHARGARVLIVEPIAKTISRWWSGWQAAFEAAGGRANEWRFAASLPPRQRALAKAAGLDPRELTARTLWLGGRPQGPLLR